MKPLYAVILLLIILGLLLVGQRGLVLALADQDVFEPPAGAIYYILAAILFFTVAVIENEQSGFFGQLAVSFKSWLLRPRRIRLPKPGKLKAQIGKPGSKKKAPKEQTPLEARRLEKRIADLEGENNELKQLVAELSMQVRKLSKKK